MWQRWTLAGLFLPYPHEEDGRWKWGAALSDARWYRSPLCLSTFLSPRAGRDWQPPLVSNVFKVTILFAADASAAGSCISFTVKEFLDSCVPLTSWQVMSGAKRCNLQHTHSSVNQEQKESKTNDTSVTYCGDKHNSPPHSNHWKHARRLFFFFFMFQNKSDVQNVGNQKMVVRTLWITL